MPKVGKKHYPYTKKGKAAAKSAAKKKGKKVKYQWQAQQVKNMETHHRRK